MNIIKTIYEIWRGRSLLRILMHEAVKDVYISGKVVDIGGGKNPEYLKYFKSILGSEIINVDISLENNGLVLDLEKDKLPIEDNSSDEVLMFNLLEHIYNYQQVVNESYRILKINGRMIGFVPFLIQYHPDPHDYFRYTKESLLKIFKNAGYKNILIDEVGGGPYFVNFNNITLSLPRILSVILYPFYLFIDRIFLKFRPNAKKRYPLGYIFAMIK